MVYNQGTVPLETYNPQSLLEGNGYSLIEDLFDPAESHVIPVGQNRDFRIRLHAKQVGTYTDTVIIESSDVNDDPFVFHLTGQVGEPDFGLTVEPSNRTVEAGSAASYTISIEPRFGFADPVTPSISGLPAGTGASSSPPSIPPAARQLTLSTTASTPPTTKIFTVTGTSGSLSRSDTGQIVIQDPADFTLEVTPTLHVLVPGGQTELTVAVDPIHGFDADVSLSLAGLLPGATHTSRRSRSSASPATAARCSPTSTPPIPASPAAARRAPFRVIGYGPEVDVWTPREPVRDRTYSMTMLGVKLAGATVTVSGGSGVTAYVVATGPGQLNGFLDVASNAPLGPRTLVVHRDALQAQVPIEVVASLADSNLQALNVTAEAARAAAAEVEVVPEILLQQFGVRDDLAWPAGVRIFSAFADLILQIRFNCFPASHIQLCLIGNIGFEIPGVAGQIFSGGGCFAGGVFNPVLQTTGTLTNFQFRNDNQCTTVTPLTPPTIGEQQA